jgi:2-aminobenzoate-CoA ligase
VAPGCEADAALVTDLQEHVKNAIAPYKYPRAVEFVAQLPKTETGKLRRFALRQMAQPGAPSSGMAAE